MALPNPRLFRGYIPDPRRRQIQVVISQEKFAVNSFEDVLEQRRLQLRQRREHGRRVQ